MLNFILRSYPLPSTHYILILLFLYPHFLSLCVHTSSSWLWCWSIPPEEAGGQLVVKPPKSHPDSAITNVRTHSNVLQSICGFLVFPLIWALLPSSLVDTAWNPVPLLLSLPGGPDLAYYGADTTGSGERAAPGRRFRSIRESLPSGVIPVASFDIAAFQIAESYGLAIPILNVRRWRHVRSHG